MPADSIITVRVQRGIAWLTPAVVLFIASAVLLSAWWFLRARDSQPLTQVLRIGYAVEAPFAFVAPDGRVTGESPEVARLVVDRLGLLSVQWRQLDFGSLVGELNAGHIDVIAAGLFITPERLQQVSFSRPTFRASAALLVAAGNPLKLHSYADLQARAARVAVLPGSVEEQLLAQLTQGGALTVVRVSDAAAGLLAVQAGQVDAFALSAPSLKWAMQTQRGGGIELATPFAVPDALAAGWVGGFAFRSEDQQLRAQWDEALAAIIGSAAHLRAIEPLGFVREDLP